jgi:hypothetical protein
MYMPGEDDDYELLSSHEIQRLRREAHTGENDFVDAINTLQRTHESVEDLKNLLQSVKSTVLEDYASSPNPEELLRKVVEQNKKIANGMVSIMKRMDKVERSQQQILEDLESQEVQQEDTPPSNPFPDNKEEQGETEGAPKEKLDGMDEMDADSPEDMGGFGDFEPLDAGTDSSEEEDKGLFKRLIGR